MGTIEVHGFLGAFFCAAGLLAGCDIAPDLPGDEEAPADDDTAAGDDDDSAEDVLPTDDDTTGSAGDDDSAVGQLPEPLDLDDSYFGDMHVHTAFSLDAYMGMQAFYNGPLAEFGEETRDPWWAYDWALDVTGLDFVAINDHAEAQPVSALVYPSGWGPYGPRELPDLWNLYLEQSRTYPRECEMVDPGDECLVIFPGFEFTGETFGHKNVVWKSLELVPDDNFAAWENRGDWNWSDLLAGGVDSFLGEVEDDQTPEDLWAWCDDQAEQLRADHPGDESQVDYFTIIHTPAEAPTHDTDWEHIDGDVMPLVEVYSKHGSSMGGDSVYEPVPDQDPQKTYLTKLAEWTETGNRDLALGVVAATDTHSAKPGNDTIDDDAVEEISRQMPFGGGVAGVVAAGKTRDDIWEALRARRTFGTSGPKIRVLLRAHAPNRLAWQGEIVEPHLDRDWELVVSARTDTEPVSGEYLPLDRVEIWADGDAGIPLCAIDAGAQDEAHGSCDLELEPGNRTSVMAVAIRTDGERAWSSPIFFDDGRSGW